MSGMAKTLDKYEEKSIENPLADPGVRLMGKTKQEYGERQDVNTSEKGNEGFYAGKKKKKSDEALAKEQRDAAEAKAARTAAEAASLEKGQESQRQGLKRKGRRASILTSPQGVVDDQLGIPG